MATKIKKYRSEIAEAVHEGVSGMHRLGLVDKKTMRDFDLRCLTTVEDLSGNDIQALREREGISQAVLARCLNLTTGQISQLERGAKHARGATLKLLCLIEEKGLEIVL
jgi:putative transcriptional regulator